MLHEVLTELHSVPSNTLLLSCAASFLSVGLRGFQTKNVQGNHYKLVWVTSYLMGLSDALNLSLIAHNGLVMALPSSTGASFGMITAMWLHSRLVKPKGADNEVS